MCQLSHVKAMPWICAAAALFSALLFLGGCAGHSASRNTPSVSEASSSADRRISEAMALRPPKAAPTDGSLWDEDSALGEMFINAKARKIGDILTIKIVESSSATNKAATSTGRNSELSAGVNSFFGAENNYLTNPAYLNPFAKVSGNMASDYKGTGSTERSGALTAYMTARIVDVLSNGNLFIQGNREVRVNHENQVITLSGIVRPRDISADNVIQSTYIADAQIAYSGTGILNDRQKPGWFVRIMDKVWPF